MEEHDHANARKDDYPGWFRWAFGRPRVWHAIVWALLGFAGAAFGLASLGHVANAWLYFVVTGFAWAISALQLVIALHDREHRSGSYAPPGHGSDDSGQ
ncbi:hypothetical protein P5G50_02325 [Leifsonia sp. F6_8S_P_1B]|uniref:Uncharacterized protein n=1 Tax=Leifsonia williamsii TaxID=3035919 RepID=A0ABT8K9W5_9MICO|nr:hypothetical protein [Leifsonia williamsii]MDN4613277.1 hypothetical protein [Leifsonia williamsii]